MRHFIFALFLSVAVISYGQEKYALVIGNSNYSNYGTLRNSINDANDMKDILNELGFNVNLILDGSLSQMENAAMSLKNRLSEAGNNSIGFFYYAGHGIELGGINYLIPANANIPDRNYLRERAFSVQVMLDMLNDSRNDLNIVVLDACRDFPANWSRTLNRGLSIISNPPANHIIMYATGAGQVASDGTGRNGLFTSHLMNNLKQPLDVNEIFRRTMVDVTSASRNEQRPALYTDFGRTVYFRSELALPSPQPQPVITPSVTVPPGGEKTEQTTVFYNDPFRIQGMFWTYNNERFKPYSSGMRDIFMKYPDTSQHYLSGKRKITTSWVCIGVSTVGLVMMVAGMPSAMEGKNTGLFWGGAGLSLTFSITSFPFSFSSARSMNSAIESFNNNARREAMEQK